MPVDPVSQQPDWIYSSHAQDPDLSDLVDLFVAEMPDRVANILSRFESRDWEGLQRAAHQLKGAAGSYGFAPITPVAARLESAIRQNEPEASIRKAVEDLVALCRRMRAGAP